MRLIEEGKHKDIKSCFLTEFHVACTMLRGIREKHLVGDNSSTLSSDFKTGVEHVLIDKKGGMPSWSPSSLKSVMEDRYFQKTGQSKWAPIRQDTFRQYTRL